MKDVKKSLELAGQVYNEAVEKLGDDVGAAYQVGIEILSSVGASVLFDNKEQTLDVFLSEVDKSLRESISYKLKYLEEKKGE